MKSSRSGLSILAILAVALGGAVAFGVGPRLKQREALAHAEAELAKPRRVHVAVARAGDPKTELTLPGTCAPFKSSLLYAKSSGYVRRNLVDIGDHVKAGQLLAEIDAPETAEEIRLARARLEEAQANVGLARATADRAEALSKAGVVSLQQNDDAHAQANSAIAAVSTRKAELQRLEVLRGYQQIVAPFDGIVTRRGTDPGALVGAASSGGVPLFEVADVETLRVFVDVPDAYASDVKVDVDALTFSPRDPAKKLAGKVVRTTGVLEQATRTLRTQIHVHGEGAVLPGSFVYVTLALPRARPVPIVPASALVVRKEGTLVALIQTADGASRVTLKKIALGRDFGKEIEVLDGIKAGDQVIVNPSDELETGTSVEIAPPPKAPGS